MKKALLLCALCISSLSFGQSFDCIGDEIIGIGLAGIYPCNGYDLKSQITLSEIAAASGGVASTGSDSWGWTDPDSGREFAIFTYSHGTAFIEITDPVNPIILGTIPVPNATPQSLWHDVKVYQNHAFIVSEDAGMGMQVFDLTRLLNVSNPPEVFTLDAHDTSFGSAHNIVINEETGYAYPVGTRTADDSARLYDGGPLFINIQDPTNPINEGGFDANLVGINGYSHDAQVVIYDGPDPDYQGREIYLGSNEETLIILDITDKQNPIFISELTYDSFSYTHQGWFTEDKRFFLLGDELDEIDNGFFTRTIIYDLEDLDNPLIHFIFEGHSTATDHNGYVKDDKFYLASYTAGLRVYDISDIENRNMTEIGFFDTFPPSDVAGTAALWNVYPYFPSGNIILSDFDAGLFVVSPSETLNVPNNNILTSFTLGPNPSKQFTTIQAPQNNINQIEVYSILGERILLEQNLKTDYFKIDTSKLPSGTYLVKINSKFTKKLLVQ